MTSRTVQPAWSPWRLVIGFGSISLAADMVYEGARSVYGPLLVSLGATAFVVSAVTGAGEAVALLLRLVSGRWADRTRRYWALTIAGYGLTAVCVPLLAVTPELGGLGLSIASVLILSERVGKAVRSPSKSALLADAAGHVGMGRGLGVHKALDQIGAFAGPLLVAALIAVGSLQLGLGALAVPGALAMALLLVTRRRMPEPQAYPLARVGGGLSQGLPRQFWGFAVAMALSTAGLVTFGLVSFHLVDRDLVGAPGVPLIYAMAMAAGAVAALAVGVLYDKRRSAALLLLPVMVAVAPTLMFTNTLTLVLLGIVIWGAAMGLQDSSVKAAVAELVPRDRRATAYGLFAAVQGVGALLGGLGAGLLYEAAIPALIVAVIVVQILAAGLVGKSLTAKAPGPGAEARSP